MTCLLDSHALLWAMLEPERIPSATRQILENSARVVSAASAWELAIKHSKGKLDFGELNDPTEFLELAKDKLHFSYLPIHFNEALLAASLPEHHNDPFDRMLIAQTNIHGLRLISCDTQFDAYGVQRVW